MLLFCVRFVNLRLAIAKVVTMELKFAKANKKKFVPNFLGLG